jgi:hypothetical protein
MLSAICIHREFNVWYTGKSSPIVEWLRALARKAHADCGGRGVGAIGMCFTGGFALAMMTESTVVAPVLSQPSYVGGPGWQAFFGVLNSLVGCGHMSGLLARRIWPLALMKSDGLGPDHCGELCAHDG